MKRTKLTLHLISLTSIIVLLQGCWFAAGAATGAATAEVMDEEGYEITSPVQKEDEDD